MQAKRKNRPTPPATQETDKEAERKMAWFDAVSAVASEIEALADAISTLAPDKHPTVFVLVAVMLQKAHALRTLMRQKWSAPPK